MDFLRFAELDAIVVRTKGFLPTAENCNRVYYSVGYETATTSKSFHSVPTNETI